MIDISGLDRAAVLAALYNGSRRQGLGVFNQAGIKTMSTDEARSILANSGERPYFDYLNGRVMKVSIDGDALEERLYDRDNGSGAAAQAIDSIR